jgi:hypothetical protein
MAASNMRPMSGFDPSQQCVIHDGLNDCWMTWDPDRDAEHDRLHAAHWDRPGIVAWDGLLLDGWLDSARTAPLLPASRRRPR